MRWGFLFPKIPFPFKNIPTNNINIFKSIIYGAPKIVY